MGEAETKRNAGDNDARRGEARRGYATATATETEHRATVKRSAGDGVLSEAFGVAEVEVLSCFCFLLSGQCWIGYGAKDEHEGGERAWSGLAKSGFAVGTV